MKTDEAVDQTIDAVSSAPPTQAPADAADFEAGIRAIWERSRDTVMARVSAIESAAAALLAGALAPEERRSAEREAHKLAGVAGTFGFHHASPLAREAEHLLQGEDDISAGAMARLAEIGAEIRRQLTATAVAIAAPESSGPTLAVFDADSAFVERLKGDARLSGIRVVAEATSVGACSAVLREKLDAVLLDLALDGDGMAVLEALHAGNASLPIFVRSDQQDLAVRVAAARAGARGFLRKPTATAEVVDLLRDSLAVFRNERAKILAFDAAAGPTHAIEQLLLPLGIDITYLTDPGDWWTALSAAPPDLLLVAAVVPEIGNADLCRAVRGNPARAAMPIVCLVASTDPAAAMELYAAGATDVIPATANTGDVAARVMTHVRQTRALSRSADVDLATGVSTKRRALAEIERALSAAMTADKHEETPLAIAVVSVDGLDAAAREHGQLLGREAMSVAATHLRASFPGGVIGRWSDSRYIVAMPGDSEDAAVQRIAGMLEAVSEHCFPTPTGDTRLIVSAGLAVFPPDGVDCEMLTQAAAAAAQEASELGGNRVRTVRQRTAERKRSGLDVVVIDDDLTIAAMVERALQMRGYSVRVIADGLSATSALAGLAPPVRARVILLDLGLPGQDGFAVLRALRQSGVMTTTRVMVLTARADQTEVARAIKLGAMDYIVKPFDVPELIKRVRLAVEMSEH